MRISLHIGINDYPGTGNDLSGCVNDANDWAALCREEGFDQVETLLDGQATKQNMLSAISKQLRRLNYGDLLVLTYSGHGSYTTDTNGDEADRRDECLCPYDIWTEGPITDDELYELFQIRDRGARFVFISDSCHSGTVNRFAPPLIPDEKPRRVRFLPPRAFAPNTPDIETPRVGGKSRRSALLMAGSLDREYSYDAWFGDRPNGAFTRAAIDAYWETHPATYREWVHQIRLRLPSPDYPQTPQLDGASYQQAWMPFGSGR